MAARFNAKELGDYKGRHRFHSHYREIHWALPKESTAAS